MYRVKDIVTSKHHIFPNYGRDVKKVIHLSGLKKMKGQHIKTGKNGEEQARRFLILRGYKILDSNYRTLRGEIDIIAQDKSDIVFVEVKTRKNELFGWPTEAVNWKKQGKLRRMAQYYIQKKSLIDVSYRFDVVAITLANNSIELIEGAF